MLSSSGKPTVWLGVCVYSSSFVGKLPFVGVVCGFFQT